MEKKSYKSFHKVELLAPAKNINCAMLAIDCGADAVYIGSSDFGARKHAANSIDDIKKIVEYAHLFNVKVYVTVNTVIYDNELNQVEKLINKLYEIGVDALIIQDLGILKLDLPPIELHASTQCHNISVEKIKFLKSLNVERVVLPREFSLNEIKEVKDNVDIELEFFVHGALCVSYSGQCYLSQRIGGRSANRGECAQPCRNIYSLVDEDGKYIIKNKYLLSLKDFCLINNIEDLILNGVNSLKIEGRLKDEDYIKTVVYTYRKKLDELNVKSSDGDIITDFKPDLSKVFNRGFTKYNIEKSDINSIDTPKNKGEFIGIVDSVKNNEITINTKKKLNLNDGICCFINGELQGSTITKINTNTITLLNKLNLKKGDKLYRNFDFEYQKYAKNCAIKRKLPIEINCDLKDENIEITFKYKNNTSQYVLKNEFETANNKDGAIETIKKQFSKLGDTVFEIENINLDDEFLNNIPFLQVAKLNEIRRNLTEQLKTEILKNYKFKRRNLDFKLIGFPKDIKNDYKLNITNEKANEIYCEAGIKCPQSGYEVLSHIKNAVLMQTKNCLRKLAGICMKNCKNNKKLFLEDKYANKYPLKFDCKNCIMEILDYE